MARGLPLAIEEGLQSYAPIQDCDEVFNFWEPTHYLNHGDGLQTWELSPVYAIRSWLYIAIHAVPIQTTSWLSFMAWPSLVARPSLMASKVVGFYALRALLALVCATCEARLFSTISRFMSARIATMFLVATVTSAGTFHAATSYLSSTFAMYTFTLALSAFMDLTGGRRTAQGLTWLGIGTILGWPFIAALCFPFVAEELVSAVGAGDILPALWRLTDGFLRSLLVLAVEVTTDSAFYHRITSVPLNIVLYNVFSDSSRGPDIYGTEPWHFYIRNLLINFNVWFLLALVSLPVAVLHHFSPIAIKRPISYRTGILRTVAFTSPFYLWLAIFTIQPHKEERFMYPIYPALALNAAVALHTLLIWLGRVPYLPASAKFALTIGLLLAATVAGILRTVLLATAYTAPLRIYRHIPEQPADKLVNVCVGKEWYRFPSSYHLPSNARLRFIKSEFTGLLPGPFYESNHTWNPNKSRLANLAVARSGTWRVPDGMNDVNAEDLGKYTPVAECDYLVDSRLPSWTPTDVERDWIGEAQGDGGGGELGWHVVHCDTFLDQGSTGIVGRMVWLPAIVPADSNYTYRTLCDVEILRGKSIRAKRTSAGLFDRFGTRFHQSPAPPTIRRRGLVPAAQSRISTPHRAREISVVAGWAWVAASGLCIMDSVNTWLAPNGLPTRILDMSFETYSTWESARLAILVVFATFTTVWLGKRLLRTITIRVKGRRTSDLEKPRTALKRKEERAFGQWTPQPFTRPTPPPYPSWSLAATKPLPYRPFRYGPRYNINMGLRPMDWDSWIELDNHFPRFHADKAQRIAQRGTRCCRTAPEAWDGALELLEELIAYLPARYPSLYRRDGAGKMTNVWSGETFDATARPLAEDPMQMCARLVQDDLAIMFERPDGQYYLLAGAILLAGFWRLDDKFGMPLSEIHTSGDVPGFKEKLEKGMMNFFRRIKPESPVLRNNYFIQVDDELPWSSSIGSEDGEGIGWFTAEKNKAIRHHYFRSERQSLRRLPRSGGVVFTIRTYFHPITDICQEPYVPGRLASAVRSWGDDVSKYKGKDRYGDVLLEYLDKKHAEQVADGLDLSKEEEVRAYPY
ncbi:hypothetical protein FH972_023243 [Carpinus fangiana]|uniref:Mannosyltransferase n=1 Tax=Carpinus fangiana TaxID=176857 RepID=A0A5N6KV92_9ROSI|nr:hypothetical protein FH972_023243 [Carpinus fangiana]